jgi:molybdenum cofactor biosynthesis enzyme MoaA
MQAYNEESEKILAFGVNLKKIKICGYGEPILRFEDLKSIASHVREKGSNGNLEIQVTTTGWPYFRFISPDARRISELKEAGVSHIYLSVNALDKKNYDKLVKPGVNEIDNGAFSDALRFGEGAKEADLDVTLGFIRLGKITDEEVKSFAERYGMKYKLRDFEE